MNKNQTSGEYLAPKVKVVEMKVQHHILQASFDKVNRLNSSWDDEDE